MLKLKLDERTNTLLEHDYDYTLQDVESPELFRDLFPYDEVPKIAFNYRNVPYHMPEEIWLTDTTFRDGQQSRSPFTTKQIVDLFTFQHELGGKKGIVRQSEFFVYTKKDREALEKCMELGFEFPEITTWIRATAGDFQLIKELGIKETGILVSCSDYHIFKKMNLTRAQALEKYLNIVRSAIEHGIRPRCHFEDITRADYYGFVLPFAIELRKLMEESGIPIKIRMCDTMGYGIAFPGVALPRSVQGIVYGMRFFAQFPSELLEWHGHNDFYRVVNNSTTAWLYGCSSVNCSWLGIGERTGNCPLEAMAIEYAAVKGTTDGMDLSVISKVAEYFENEIQYEIPPRTPFVGRHFNVTRAGIHADGLLKDEEIYNIFDTEKILNRPAVVAVDSHSGNAGIAHWLNAFFKLNGENKIDKRHPVIAKIKEQVDLEFAEGRTTVFGDEELESLLRSLDAEFYAKLCGKKAVL